MIRLAFAVALFVLRLPLTLVLSVAARVRPRRRVLEVVLEGQHPFREKRRSPFSSRRDGLARRPLALALKEAEVDAEVEVVFVRMGHLSGALGELYALRNLLVSTQAAGKRVVVYLHHPDLRTLWVASAAKEVWVSPHAPLDLTGLALELSFFGEGLTRLGLGLDVVTAGAFKSAMEPFTRSEPSPENREALEALLDSLFVKMVDDISTRPGLTPTALREALDAGPLLPDEALSRGLVDALYEEEAALEAIGCGPKGRTRRVSAADYSGRRRALPRLGLRRPRLALIEVHGTIRDGKVADDGSENGATANAVCEALEAARKSRRVKGVLLHVDSRGGSATASERMFRAVRKLAEKKPVIACMGDYAASGGYYVACAAHGIVAAPGTLTGSIGVISAKPVIGGLLDRIGVSRHALVRGAHATMSSLSRRYTDEERSRVEAIIAHFYALFLRRVGEGRGRPPEALAPYAQGRVWTGEQALERGLVDRLGDERVALAWLSEKTGLTTDAGFLLFGRKRPLWRRFLPTPGTSTLVEAVDTLSVWAELEGEPLALSPIKWRLGR